MRIVFFVFIFYLIQVRIREIPVLDKLQYLYRLLSSVLPVIKQIHVQQCFEVKLEKRMQGMILDDISCWVGYFWRFFTAISPLHYFSAFQEIKCFFLGQSWMQMSRCAGNLYSVVFYVSKQLVPVHIVSFLRK